VAVKKLRFIGNKEKEKQKALKEAELMKNLKHDKIVRLWCVCTLGIIFLYKNKAQKLIK
jgi:hypothetical protein